MTAHSHKRLVSIVISFLLGGLHLYGGDPIRPLAQDHVVVGESPDAATVPLYNPSIVRLDSGRLVAGYTISGKYNPNIQSSTRILTSDDHGLSWRERFQTSIGQARLFTAGPTVYLIGSGTPLRIHRSDDNAETWSDFSVIAEGNWHQTASNFWHAKGNVYLAIEKRIGNEIKTWAPGELAPILMRAKSEDDLTRPESWTFSSELPFKDLIAGYRENDLDIDYFGVPFYRQDFPQGRALAYVPCHRNLAPMGWLETNVVQITDPAHYWYDPAGRTFHLLMRAHTGGTGYAALAKVVEDEDGGMTTSLETVPSGKRMLFLPMPGGQMRFHILYDSETSLYWLLGSQATDSMTRAEMLPADRYNLPNNERHRLVLHFSKNLVDWCFAGLVAKGESPREARHYASMAIDGEDLVILSRSGDHRAKSAHDGNLITFHRVKNFRDLVY